MYICIYRERERGSMAGCKGFLTTEIREVIGSPSEEPSHRSLRSFRFSGSGTKGPTETPSRGAG